MDGLAAKTAALLFHDPTWRVAALGDYNGDGKADRVWSSADRTQAAFWLMNGAAPIETRVIPADPNWSPL